MQFLNIVYNILVSPTQEFRVVSLGPVPKEKLLIYAVGIVVIISALGAIYSSSGAFTLDGFIIRLMLSAFVGIIFWLFTGAVFSTAAYVFGVNGRPQTLLILTAYATLPWIFLPVVIQFKGFLGSFGNTISIFGALALWLWTTILFLMAIKYTYSLSLERILLAACLPILMTFLGISWVGGFFFNFLQFFSV